MSLPPLTTLDVPAINRLVAQINRDARRRDDQLKTVAKSVTDMGRRLPETIRQVAQTQARQNTSTQTAGGTGTPRTLTSTETHLVRQVAFRAIQSLQTTGDSQVNVTLGTSPQTVRNVPVPGVATGNVLRVCGAGFFQNLGGVGRTVQINLTLTGTALPFIAIGPVVVNPGVPVFYWYEADFIIRQAGGGGTGQYFPRLLAITQPVGGASTVNIGSNAAVLFTSDDLTVQEIVSITVLDANVTMFSDFFTIELIGGRTK